MAKSPRWFLVFFLLSVGLICHANSAKNDVLGVPRHETERFVGDWFTCLTSGENISGERVNDNYCDCNDGSDEPGTSACSNVITLSSHLEERKSGFYCPNRGHKAIYISNSFVNDGICDCCDGSDEIKNEGLSCPNSCAEKGKGETERMTKEMQLHEQGAKQKEQMIREARRIKPTLQNELEEAKNKLEKLTEELEASEVAEEEARRLSELAEEASRDQEGEEGELSEEHLEAVDALMKDDPLEDVSLSVKDARSLHHSAKATTRELRQSVKDSEATVERLKVLLDSDFGLEDEFLALRGSSFSVHAGGYDYVLRPFESMHQGSTSLGDWDGWKPRFEGMSFTGGKRCWGAGDRESLVSVVCGLENQIHDVDEPSTCFYTLVFKTPAACSLEHAKALRLALDMNQMDTIEGDSY